MPCQQCHLPPCSLHGGKSKGLVPGGAGGGGGGGKVGEGGGGGGILGEFLETPEEAVVA